MDIQGGGGGNLNRGVGGHNCEGQGKPVSAPSNTMLQGISCPKKGQTTAHLDTKYQAPLENFFSSGALPAPVFANRPERKEAAALHEATEVIDVEEAAARGAGAVQVEQTGTC